MEEGQKELLELLKHPKELLDLLNSEKTVIESLTLFRRLLT